MKKETKSRRNLKIQQWYFKLSVVMALMTLFWLVLSVNNFYQYSLLPLTKEDTVSRQYTFEELKKKDGRYFVYVSEEQKPLELTSVSMHPALYDALEELHKGQTLSCLLRPSKSEASSHEIVSLSEDGQDLLSLEKYNQSKKSNLITGMILSPILTLLGAVMTVVLWCFYRYRRSKNEKKEKSGCAL